MTETKTTNKFICAIAYFGVFCFVPYVIDKKNEDYLFHANQGLILAIVSIVLAIVINIAVFFLSLIIPILGLVASLLYLIPLILLFIGASNGLKLKRNRLPYIGNFDILK